MDFQYVGACGGLLAGGEADQPQDPPMWATMHDRELAEVFVESHQHSPLPERGCQDLVITRVRIPSYRPDYVMTHGPELVGRAAPDAGIEQDLQAERFSRIRSWTRSWPTSRLAYSRHARTSSRCSHG